MSRRPPTTEDRVLHAVRDCSPGELRLLAVKLNSLAASKEAQAAGRRLDPGMLRIVSSEVECERMRDTNGVPELMFTAELSAEDGKYRYTWRSYWVKHGEGSTWEDTEGKESAYLMGRCIRALIDKSAPTGVDRSSLQEWRRQPPEQEWRILARKAKAVWQAAERPRKSA